MKRPRSVLVVVTRRIGDVLLATPLVRSLRRAWRDSRMDVLVFRGTEGVLSGNPDIDAVLTVPDRPGTLAHLRFHAGIARRYDLAVSLLTGDRPTLYAWAAGRMRAGPLADEKQAWWKRRLLDVTVPFDDLDTHVVRTNLSLAAALAVTPVADVVVAWTGDEDRQVDALRGADARAPYAVLHPTAKFNYKMWRPDGWRELARHLARRGLVVYVSGSPDPREAVYARAVALGQEDRVRDLSGRLTLGALARLLSGASIYVGPDTVVTHMAAALGIPTVSLFGPSNPVRWGPWPKGHAADGNPWRRLGTQRRGNVTLLQGTAACVPCLLEGCERHVGSYSDCLQTLAPGTVIAAAERMLAESAAGAQG